MVTDTMNIELKFTDNRFNVDVSKEFSELIERFKDIEKRHLAPTKAKITHRNKHLIKYPLKY